MRPRTTLAFAPLAFALLVLAAGASAQDEGYRHGRLRQVEPGVTLQRATDTGAEEALRNDPFLPGDRVWTDASGRAEFQFPDGSAVRLDRRSKLDYSGHEEGGDERVVLRLWSGSLIVHSRSREAASVRIETPAGVVDSLERTVLRVDVDGGEARVSVYEGEAVLDDGAARVRLTAGERSFARWGGRAEDPESFGAEPLDDFARWDEDLEAERRGDAGEARHLPGELAPYAEELERNGDWRYENTVGYVWVPQVAFGWSPYSNGRWSWTPYGWTWVPYEPWGWAPFHYGRWGYAASWGWYWMPGRTWGPGWVSWAAGGGYVGWCPLGRHDRPVAGWGHRLSGGRGHAVPRGRLGGPAGAWNVVRSGDLGHRDLARRRLSVERIDPSLVRVAGSAVMRPTRDGAALRPATAPAVSTRQRPGDFVRELGVDNRTTIPAPWTRGYGPPPAGAEGARYGVPRDDDRRESAGTAAGAGASRPRPGSAPATTAGEPSSAATERGRPAPWFRPSGRPERGDAGQTPTTGGSGEAARGIEPRGRDRSPHQQTARPREGGVVQREDARRPAGEDRAARPAPRSYGGGESRPGPRAHGGGGGGGGGGESRSSGASAGGREQASRRSRRE